MSGAECIILEDSENEEDDKSKVFKNSHSKDGMIRCNMCLDPGLLPVEEDRTKHRLHLHASKLFYCDVCEPHEKGARGFEEFKDVVKHVCNENGISINDRKNLHDMIRIPEQADFLKKFLCLFCPGQGTKFVGMKEENFLDHVRNQHGDKAPRRRPEKLVRECRICSDLALTDTELTEHVKSHLNRGSKFPFAGFGPRTRDDYNSSSEGLIHSDKRSNSDERFENWEKKTSQFIDRMKKSSSISEIEEVYKEVKESPKKKKKKKQKKRKKHASISLSSGSASSDAEEYSSRNLKRKHSAERKSTTKKQKSSKRYSKKRNRSPSSESEVELETGTWKQRSLSKRTVLKHGAMDTTVCPFCEELVLDEASHLFKHHKDNCFQCKKCVGQLFADIEALTAHFECVHPLSSVHDGLMLEPVNLEKVTCKFCRPERPFIGEEMSRLMLKVFEHLECHDNIHRGDENIINSKLVYSCRVCPNQTFSQVDLKNHVFKHGILKRDEKDSGGNICSRRSREEDLYRPRSRSSERRPRSHCELSPGEWISPQSSRKNPPSPKRRERSPEDPHLAKHWRSSGEKRSSWEHRRFLDRVPRSSSNHPDRRRSKSREQSHVSRQDGQASRHGTTSRRLPSQPDSSRPHARSPPPDRLARSRTRSGIAEKSPSRSSARTREYKHDFTCSFCGERFAQLFPGMDHVIKEHRSELTRDVDDNHVDKYLVYPSVLMKVSCRFCEEYFFSEPHLLRSELREHREVHLSKDTSTNLCFTLECRVCSVTFDNLNMLSNMENHTSLHQMKGTSIGSSDFCKFCIQPYSDLEKHALSIHKKDMFGCHLCQRYFTTLACVMIHLEVYHKKPKGSETSRISKPSCTSSLMCRLCSEVFSCDVDLLEKRHFSKYHDQEFNLRLVKFLCRLCEESIIFDTRSDCEAHLRDRHSKSVKDRLRTTSNVQSGGRTPMFSINQHLDSARKERLSVKERLGAPRQYVNNKHPGENWRCGNCNYDNFSRNQDCRICHTSRTEAENKKLHQTEGAPSFPFKKNRTVGDEGNPNLVKLNPVKSTRLLSKGNKRNTEGIDFLEKMRLEIQQLQSQSRETKDLVANTVEDILDNVVQLSCVSMKAQEIERDKIDCSSQRSSSPEYNAESSDNEVESDKRKFDLGVTVDNVEEKEAPVENYNKIDTDSEQQKFECGETVDNTDEKEVNSKLNDSEARANGEDSNGGFDIQVGSLDGTGKKFVKGKAGVDVKQKSDGPKIDYKTNEYETRPFCIEINVSNNGKNNEDKDEAVIKSKMESDKQPIDQSMASDIADESGTDGDEQNLFQRNESKKNLISKGERVDEGTKEKQNVALILDPSDAEVGQSSMEAQVIRDVDKSTDSSDLDRKAEEDTPEVDGNGSDEETEEDESSSEFIQVESVDHLKRLLKEDGGETRKYFTPSSISETEEYKQFLLEQDTHEDFDVNNQVDG